VGNGVTEPLGISLASGLTALNSTFGTGGPLAVDDAEALIFGVQPQYRMMDLNPAFIGSDTSYRRFRGIAVAPTDERRVFGQGMMGTDETQRYQLFEYKYRPVIDLPNTTLLFGCLKKYRMYQRAGYEIVRESGGRALTLANTSLIGLRGRFGGRVVDGAAFAKISDAQN
jgi:HK97 family phage major capsid protein